MAPQKKDATGLIAGPLKVTARTDRKDRDKRVVFAASCVCGAIEHGAIAVLGRYLGHGLTCPGHPLKKSNEKPDGSTFFPDQQPEYDVALAAWEAARHTGQVKEDSEVNIAADTTTTETLTTVSAPVVTAGDATPSTETPIVVETVSTTEGTAAVTPIIAVATPAAPQKPPKAVVNKDTSTKMSAILATRLKLVNYHTISKKLTPPVTILGQDATSVVFAEDAAGTDRVMLHICLSSTDGKKSKSIVSSMKKISTEDFSTLTSTLTGMKITWRSKDQPRVAA
jgi:hypothetical protein